MPRLPSFGTATTTESPKNAAFSAQSGWPNAAMRPIEKDNIAPTQHQRLNNKTLKQPPDNTDPAVAGTKNTGSQPGKRVGIPYMEVIDMRKLIPVVGPLLAAVLSAIPIVGPILAAILA
jgi:hypothetical protein